MRLENKCSPRHARRYTDTPADPDKKPLVGLAPTERAQAQYLYVYLHQALSSSAGCRLLAPGGSTHTSTPAWRSYLRKSFLKASRTLASTTLTCTWMPLSAKPFLIEKMMNELGAEEFFNTFFLFFFFSQTSEFSTPAAGFLLLGGDGR